MSAILRSFLASLFLMAAGCTDKPAPEQPAEQAAENNPTILKVAVHADGRITADGSATTIDGLRSSIKQLSEKGGSVWYYREQGQAEPPPQAMEVMQVIIENRVPIKLSSKPDYSDVIDASGQPVR